MRRGLRTSGLQWWFSRTEGYRNKAVLWVRFAIAVLGDDRWFGDRNGWEEIDGEGGWYTAKMKGFR